MFLYNTMARKKQEFKPIDDKNVLLYTCGPTVYDYAHIGNLRAFIFEDLLKRTLEYNGFSVKHTMNLTDVGHLVSDSDTGEDKMTVGAKRERKSAWEIADFYINAFKEDAARLRIREPTFMPRATDNINEMTGLIKILDEKGFAYKTKDGIYFDTSRLDDYGKLARLKSEGLKPGARVKIGQKKSPTDFALWKFSHGKKRDMEWDSPFGRGFPGWHIECSVMAMRYLAETIDIHCGGIDHVPVHHTNEIAQSEAATGKRFVNYWMHNEFMLVNNRKMSKSLGNYYTLRDLEKKGFSPLAFRYLCMSVHYRSQMNFTLKSLRSAEKTVKSLNDFAFRLKNSIPSETKNRRINKTIEKAEKDFTAAISDDLDAPRALSALFDFMNVVNREIDDFKMDKESLENAYAFFMRADIILDVLDDKEITLTKEEKKLVEMREDFRARKNYREADEIRVQLRKKGIILEDTPDGVKAKRK